jgi:hypothetical protein
MLPFPHRSRCIRICGTQQVAKRSSSDDDLRLMRLHFQRVRFARPDILFYDAHRIELYRSMRALYFMP